MNTIDDKWEHLDQYESQKAIEWLAGSLNDRELMSKIVLSEYGHKFKLLWEGRWKELQYPSQSEADLAFIRILSNNHAPIHQIDRIFRRSKLMRAKWDEQRGGSTYGMITLEKGTYDESTKI
jgi:putative DNA primase/helicase